MPASTAAEVTEQPSRKEQARKYLQARFIAGTPPPSRDAIRVQMGWAMLEQQLADKLAGNKR